MKDWGINRAVEVPAARLASDLGCHGLPHLSHLFLTTYSILTYSTQRSEHRSLAIRRRSSRLGSTCPLSLFWDISNRETVAQRSRLWQQLHPPSRFALLGGLRRRRPSVALRAQEG